MSKEIRVVAADWLPKDCAFLVEPKSGRYVMIVNLRIDDAAALSPADQTAEGAAEEARGRTEGGGE